MGRPLNKRYLGDPANPGTQLSVSYWDGSAPATGYIVKQLGSRRYRVTTDGVTTFDGALVDSAPTQDGEIQLSHPSGNVMKLTARKALLGDGTSVSWVIGDFPGVAVATTSQSTRSNTSQSATVASTSTEDCKSDVKQESIVDKIKNVISEPKADDYKPSLKIRAPKAKTTHARTTKKK